MTRQEFSALKEKIEMQYREDMAALERVYSLCNAAESLVVLDDPEPAIANGVVSAATLGIDTKPQIFKKRRSLKGLSPEERRKAKSEYMKEYLRTYRKKTQGGYHD